MSQKISSKKIVNSFVRNKNGEVLKDEKVNDKENKSQPQKIIVEVNVHDFGDGKVTDATVVDTKVKTTTEKAALVDPSKLEKKIMKIVSKN